MKGVNIWETLGGWHIVGRLSQVITGTGGLLCSTCGRGLQAHALPPPSGAGMVCFHVSDEDMQPPGVPRCLTWTMSNRLWAVGGPGPWPGHPSAPPWLWVLVGVEADVGRLPGSLRVACLTCLAWVLSQPCAGPCPRAIQKVSGPPARVNPNTRVRRCSREPFNLVLREASSLPPLCGSNRRHVINVA